MQVVLSEQAEHDLETILLYYLQEAGEQVMSKVENQLFDDIFRIG